MPKRIRLAIIAYVPVIHSGYIDFFEEYKDADLHIVGRSLWKKLDYIRKDLRQLAPEQAKDLLNGRELLRNVSVVEEDNIHQISDNYDKIIMPDEDIAHALRKLYFKSSDVEYYPIFLRWDRRNSEKINNIDDAATISVDKFVQDIMRMAFDVAEHSSDIWRQVGAVVLDKDNKLVASANNTGEPTPHSPWMEGDPRNILNRGVGMEMSVFTHAEANLIAEAARNGRKLQGGSLYVTTYPCPACAKLIAKSGIKVCYFAEGYAILDGKRVLDDYGVKVIKVDGVAPIDKLGVWRKYPEKKKN